MENAEDKGIDELQLGKAQDVIHEYYAKNGLDYYSIPDEIPLPWWPEELVEADKTIKAFWAQIPEGYNI